MPEDERRGCQAKNERICHYTSIVIMMLEGQCETICTC